MNDDLSDLYAELEKMDRCEKQSAYENLKHRGYKLVLREGNFSLWEKVGDGT